MKTRAFALITVAVLLGGCRENLGSVVSHGFCGPPEDAGVCALPAVCETFVAGQFQVSFAQTDHVETSIEWENLLVNNEGDNRNNTNDFYLRGYQYEVSAPFELPDSIASYRTSFENEVWIPAGESRNVPVDILHPDVGTFLSSELSLRGIDLARVKVKVKAYGRLADDAYYETGTVQAAIEIDAANPFAYACPPGEMLFGVCPNNGQVPATPLCDKPATTTP